MKDKFKEFDILEERVKKGFKETFDLMNELYKQIEEFKKLLNEKVGK